MLLDEKEPSTSTQGNEEISRDEEKENHWKDQFLRVSADFQNYKRRVEKERGDLVMRSQIEVIKKLLPVIDDLERALAAREGIDTNDATSGWLEGFIIIEKNLKKTLTDMALYEIDTKGAFNPLYHEAIAHVPSSEHKQGDIVAVVQKGYRWGEYIIRPALVSVAS